MIPILGWSWSFTESVFLRRVWESDKKVLERDIQRIVDDYPKDYYFNVRHRSFVRSFTRPSIYVISS